MPASRAGLAVRIALGVTLGLVLVVAVTWIVADQVAEPDEPGAFYDPPETVDEPPGTILRSETVAGAQTGATVSKILYASTNPAGDPIAVSGVVITPDGRVPPGGRPVIAWSHGTSGVAPRCAPSLESRAGLARIPGLERLLDAGAIVVTTDYPGLGTPGPHPYLVGESEGRALLDAARAGIEIGGAEAGRAAVYGHSQGGHAALFAAALAPTYASALDLAGAAPIAPPTDLAELMRDDESEMAGAILTGFAVNAWSDYYPDTPGREVVKREFLPAIDDLSSKCIETNTQDVLELPDVLDLDGRFLATDPAEVPAWKPHFAANTPPSDVPLQVPLLVVQGTADDIVRPDVTRSWVESQCAAGSVVDYRAFAGETHFTIRTAAAPEVADWMLARTSGEPATSNCADF